MWRFCVGLVFATMSLGQAPEPGPFFDVAALKLNLSDPAEPSSAVSNGHLTITNIPLRYLIAEAWKVPPDSVYGPPWLDDVRVDLNAKAASPQTTGPEMAGMIRTLLKQRMKMVVHVEQRQQSVWALTVWHGKHGKPTMTPSDMPSKPGDVDCNLVPRAAGLHFTCTHLTMSELAYKLPQVASGYADRRVVDETGLPGARDIALDWMPKTQESDGGKTLFAALQAQLGLQLVSKKAAVSVVVVDSMDQTPAEN